MLPLKRQATCVNRTGGVFAVAKRAEIWYTVFGNQKLELSWGQM
jgi:hypothetical protein